MDKRDAPDDRTLMDFEPLPLALAGETPRRPRPIEDFLGPQGEHEAFGLVFPVLVLNVGTNPVTMRAGIVYPIASMLPIVPRTIGPLPDELARLSIGRAAASDIVLDHRTASRRHASLVRRREGRWSIVDEGSANGTFLQGTRLRAGEAVSIEGSVVVLRFGDATMSFLDSAAFGSFLASLEGTRLTLGDTTRALRTMALSAAASRRTLPTGTRRSKVAEALVACLQASPIAWRSYRVVLADAPVQEFESLAGLLAFVEENADRVLAVETDVGLGRTLVLYSIDGQGLPPRSEPTSAVTRTDLRGAGSLDARGKILVVEDDAVFRRDVCEALEGEGFAPVGAGDGRDAIRFLRTSLDRVSAVILDLRMPNLDGLELHALMRGDPHLASIPVIVVSGMPKLDAVVSGLGIACAIQKPIDVEELIGRVRSFVGAGAPR